jgi:uncharacterized protein (UPF0248 family)
MEKFNKSPELECKLTHFNNTDNQRDGMNKMKSIRDMLNKIKWDTSENPEKYRVVYADRFEGSIEIPYCQVIEIFKAGINIIGDDFIPYHKIREIKKGSEIVWKRKMTSTNTDHSTQISDEEAMKYIEIPKNYPSHIGEFIYDKGILAEATLIHEKKELSELKKKYSLDDIKQNFEKRQNIWLNNHDKNSFFVDLEKAHDKALETELGYLYEKAFSKGFKVSKESLFLTHPRLLSHSKEKIKNNDWELSKHNYPKKEEIIQSILFFNDIAPKYKELLKEYSERLTY